MVEFHGRIRVGAGRRLTKQASETAGLYEGIPVSDTGGSGDVHRADNSAAPAIAPSVDLPYQAWEARPEPAEFGVKQSGQQRCPLRDKALPVLHRTRASFRDGKSTSEHVTAACSDGR